MFELKVFQIKRYTCLYYDERIEWQVNYGYKKFHKLVYIDLLASKIGLPLYTLIELHICLFHCLKMSNNIEHNMK